ncbi:hypothetical protein FRC18_002135 [Serendipita sp. 400]|nr:hypothetical protein FRC18_002135 [Serendipita sp. 400]
MNRVEARHDARTDRRYGTQLPYGSKPLTKKPKAGAIGKAMGLVKKWSFFDFDSDVPKSREVDTDAESSKSEVNNRKVAATSAEQPRTELSTKFSFSSRLRTAVQVASSRGFTRHRMPGEFYKPKSRPSTPATTSTSLPELSEDPTPEISKEPREDKSEYTRYRVPGAFPGYSPQTELRLGSNAANDFKGLLGSNNDLTHFVQESEALQASGALIDLPNTTSNPNEPESDENAQEGAKDMLIVNDAGADPDVVEEESAVSAIVSIQEDNAPAKETGTRGSDAEGLRLDTNDATSESNNRTDSGSDHLPSPTAPTFGLPPFHPDASQSLVPPPVHVEDREMTAEEVEQVKAELMTRNAQMRNLLEINYFDCHEPEAWNDLLRYKNPKSVAPSFTDSSEEEEFDGLRLGKRRDPNEGFSIEEIMRNPYSRISAFGDRPRSDLKAVLEQMSKRQRTGMSEMLKKQLAELNYEPPKPSRRAAPLKAKNDSNKTVTEATTSEKAAGTSAAMNATSSGKAKQGSAKGLMLPPPVPAGKGEKLPPPRLRPKPGQRNVLLAPLAQVTKKPYHAANPIGSEPTKDKPEDANSGNTHGEDYKGLKRSSSDIVCVGADDAFDPPEERPLKRRKSNGEEITVDANLEKTLMVHTLDDDIEMVYMAEGERATTLDEGDGTNDDDDLVDETPEPPSIPPPQPKPLRRKPMLRSDVLRPKNSLHSPINPSPLRFMSKFGPDSPETAHAEPEAPQATRNSVQGSSLKQGMVQPPPKTQSPPESEFPTFSFPVELLVLHSIGQIRFTEEIRKARIKVSSYPPSKMPVYPFDLSEASSKQPEKSGNRISGRTTAPKAKSRRPKPSSSDAGVKSTRTSSKLNGTTKSVLPDSIPPLRLPSHVSSNGAPSGVTSTSATSTLQPAPDSTRRGFDWARAGLAPPTQADTWKCNTCLIGGNKGDKCVCCEAPRPS